MDNDKRQYNIRRSYFSIFTLTSIVGALSLTLTNTFLERTSQQSTNTFVQFTKAISMKPALAEEYVVPSPNCLGGEPCTSPNPSAEPSSLPTNGGTNPQNPPANPTNNPCVVNDASVQTYQSQKKHKKAYKSNNGNHYGWFSQFLQFLIRFLEELLRQLGIQPNTNPTPNTPGNNNQPNQPGQPEQPEQPGNDPAPTTDPCASYTPGPAAPTQIPAAEPTQNTTQPTQNPAQPTNGQTNPTTVPQTPPGTNAQGFLSANGKNLMFNGQVYKYVGVNAFQIAGTVEYGADYSKAELDAFFAALPPRSLTRAWAWNDSNMDQMRRAVQSAEEHNQLLILVLSEGAGWDKVGQRPDAWYRDGYKSYLLPWVDTVVGEFKNSKAIGMWEIMNEPAGDQQNPSHEAVKGFMSAVAARIKQNDPNHLVGTGAIRCSVPGFGDGCADINNDPNIDVMSSHDYSGDETVTGTYYEDKKQLDAINKPWIIGEAGIKGGDYGGGGGSCPISGADRAAKIKQKIDAYFNDGRVSGVNLWVYKKDANCNSNNDGYDFNTSDQIMEVLRSYKTQ